MPGELALLSALGRPLALDPALGRRLVLGATLVLGPALGSHLALGAALALGPALRRRELPSN